MEDSIPDPPGEVLETLVSHGSVMLMESREKMTPRIKSLVGVLRKVVDVELPERFQAVLKGVVLRDRFLVY